VRSHAGTSRRRGSAAAKALAAETLRTSSNHGALQFRIDFRVEHVVEARDIRGALRQADALGATDIAEIVRVGS
jgi:hypothetical protein